MANPNPPADTSGALSAAELRRRLLASTPPPLAGSADDTPDAADAPTGGWGSGADLLARLKMPGKSGPVRAPDARTVTIPDAPPPRVPVNRRTPVPGAARGYDPITGAVHSYDDPYSGPPSNDVQRLRAENKELRTLLDEMKQLLQEASDSEAKYAEQMKPLQTALEERDAQITELSTHLQMIEDQIAKGELVAPPPIPKTRGELEEWADELEKESSKLAQDRKRLENDRRQLREDEETLETQMREMEVGMARERALLARQETELKRLSAEIQHELELMQRGDANLREQMTKFQRRAQEVMTTRPGGGSDRFPGRR